MLKRPSNLNILLICAFLSALIAFIIVRANNNTTSELARAAELKLHAKEGIAQQNINAFTLILKKTNPKDLFKKYNGSISDLFKNEGIAIYVYDNDSLCFWSDNQPAVDLYAYAKNSNNYYFTSESLVDKNLDFDTAKFNVQLLKIRNGWYECIRHIDSTHKKCTIAALILIKPEYDFENSYINNDFSSWLKLPVNTELKTEFNYSNPSIKSKFGETLFEIYRSEGLYKSKAINTTAVFFTMLAGLLFLLFLFAYLRKKFSNKILLLVVFTTICFALRTAMIYFKYPGIFYNTILYDANLFANASSFYFSYMGDVVINCGLIFMVGFFIYKLNFDFTVRSSAFNLTALFFSTVYVVYLYHNIPVLIGSLVNNSTISYNINELFNFNSLSLLGLLSIALLFFSFYLVVEKTIVSLLSNNSLNYLNSTLFFFVVLGTILIVNYWHLNYADYLWPVPIIIISYFLRKYKASYNFINTGLIILVSTLITFTLFSKYEELNKQQTYDALSLNLTDRQDVIAENEFAKIITSIKTDTRLKNLISLLPLSNEQIEQEIRQVNFSGYFERYDVVMSLFKNDSIPVFRLTDQLYLNENYFKKQIKEDGFQTISDDLYFIDKAKKPIRYIAEIDIEDINKNPEKTYRLYLQLEPKLSASLGNFPDLLLDKSIESKIQSKNISYAVYEFNKLLTVHGEYEYPLFLDNTFVNSDKHYKHYEYNYTKNTKIIISDKKFDFWQKFTSNSYLFLFFSLIVLIALFFNSIVINKLSNFNSLNIRIQFIFVSIVILSLTCVVIGTVYIVTSQFEVKNEKELILKSHSVLKELQQNIGDLNTLEPSYKDYTTYSLKKLSLLFGSDISLFTKEGILFSSSQPAIYDQGLISRFMNPEAYSYFSKQIRANYTQRESIGSLKYLSAYIPFYNKRDRLIGYINLPYFARQKDLEKELTAYLTTLINIYTILFVITTLIALLVSNLLTKPLRIIKQQISNIKFGTRNESIDWLADDEIGELVKEYNKMLVKLEKNSELLAQSERESAWREMAKQVAHEIKNPLTPMKLNIQHLQRVAFSNPTDMSERVDKVSNILIEQIDTLSHIATEFSNFAKLPKANLEIIYINEILENVSNLFKQNTECKITMLAVDGLYIRADRDQCIRIFTNLLKNAEQSIPFDREGSIEISTFLNEQDVVIKVKDNGCGIPENLQSRIFTPNFTTKNTGTGLGLAMVKNLVVSFNGTIAFETQENVGTTFIITFPKLTIE